MDKQPTEATIDGEMLDTYPTWSYRAWEIAEWACGEQLLGYCLA